MPETYLLSDKESCRKFFNYVK